MTEISSMFGYQPQSQSIFPKEEHHVVQQQPKTTKKNTSFADDNYEIPLNQMMQLDLLDSSVMAPMSFPSFGATSLSPSYVGGFGSASYG